MILPERFDGVFAGGFEGREEAEQDAHTEGHDGSSSGCKPGECRVEVQEGAGDEGKYIAREVTKKAADEAYHKGFNKELGDDISVARADCFADTNFSGAFGHTNQHDIHDADATDKQ